MSLIGDSLKKILDSIRLKPAPVRKVLVPGVEVVWDECDCGGQLSIRIMSIQPMMNGRCITGWWVTIGVSIVRCVSVLDDAGTPPSAAQVTKDGLKMLSDMEDLREQLLCLENEGVVQRLQLQSWTPLGAEGGCAGGEWEARVLLPSDCEC